MPNWCRNELRVRPSNWQLPEVELEEFLDVIRETTDAYKERVMVWMEENKKKKRPTSNWSRPSPRGIFDFNSLVPYPEAFKQRDMDAATLSAEDFKAKYPANTDKVLECNKEGPSLDGYNNGGSEWRNQNWGTKWGASNVVWVSEHATLYFETAWGPVFTIISAIHKRFPHLSLDYEYYESGMGFMGGCQYIPEKLWEPDLVPMGKEHEIEMAMKEKSKPPEYKWEAGQAYDFWEQEYHGYKGG